MNNDLTARKLPDYQTLMLPLLELHGDDSEHTFREVIEALASRFQLNEEERRELLPSGKQFTFDNRVGWARTYLTKAGVLTSPKRSVFRITPRGKEVLAAKPSELNVKFLGQFAEFREFRAKRNDELGETANNQNDKHAGTPQEALEAAYQILKDELSAELLTNLKQVTPAFFEKLVVDVLVRMGYGGSRSEAGRAIGGWHDGGIDGTINEDRLGLDTIYIQAKRWEGVVSCPEIQQFAGALQGVRARKGVFITTSTFTKDAVEYASRIEAKIVLIDGERLVALMFEHNVGITSQAIYEVKKMDLDYFEEA